MKILCALLLFSATVFPADTLDTYRQKALEVMVKTVENGLKLQMPSGRFVTKPEDAAKNPEDCIYFLTRIKERYMHGQYLILPCAILYSYKSPKNPYYKDPKIIAAIDRGMAFLDTTLEYSFHIHRLCSYLALAYPYVEKGLSAQQKALYLKVLRRGAGDIAERVKAGEKHTGNYTTKDIGVNTNHWGIYNMCILRSGKVLGEKGWVETAKQQLKNMAAIQNPDGYWDEWNGPTPSYNYVDVYAVNGYYAETRDPAALEALRRATLFQIFTCYPNGSKMETMDGRVQMAGSPNLTGHAGFSHSPEGRRFALQLLTQKFIGKPDLVIDQEECATLTENFLLWESGPEAPLPTEKAAYAWALTKPAGVRRAGPWLATCSAIPFPTWQENQFFLDRQMHLSLWHDSTGLILTGPASKGHQRGGIFYMNRNLDQVVSLLTAGTLKQNEKNGDTLLGEYDGYSSTLVMKPVNDNEFEITGKVALGQNPTLLFPPDFTMNLFLGLKMQDTIETELGGKIVLTSEYKEYPPYKVGKWIKKGKWKLEFPANTMFIWPYMLFNPYSFFGYSDEKRAFPEGVVSMTFPSRDAEIKCRLVVGK